MAAGSVAERVARMGIAAMTPRGMRVPVSERLPEAIERLVVALQPERIILFGSYAYGTPTPDSDVDLLVVMDTEASYVERDCAVSEQLYPREFPVDILTYTPDELAEALAAGNHFLREVIARGRVLYERGQ